VCIYVCALGGDVLAHIGFFFCLFIRTRIQLRRPTCVHVDVWALANSKAWIENVGA